MDLIREANDLELETLKTRLVGNLIACNSATLGWGFVNVTDVCRDTRKKYDEIVKYQQQMKRKTNEVDD